MAEFSDYAWMVGDDRAAALLTRLAEDPRPALQQLNSLRREAPVDRARLLIEQIELRRRAAAKFGERASQMFFTPTLLEQATDWWVARYKAGRFMPLAPSIPVNDYCCGIGGDLMALAARGACLGWDLSEVACRLASANLRAMGTENAIRQADVSQLTPPPDEMWHVDPERRSGGRRSTMLEWHSPGPAVIDDWLKKCPNGAMKLAPAAEPPADWVEQAELEWITCHRQCRQLVVWFGELAEQPGKRRATKLMAKPWGGCVERTITGAPNVSCDAVSEPRRYLYDPDPSVLAAKLLGQLAAGEHLSTLGSGGAYLTGDRDLDNSLLQKFVVQDCLPLRAATVAGYLAARGVGTVEIKKRGVTLDPEEFRRNLKLHGDNAATVVLTRIGKRQVAIIAQRLPEPSGLNELPAGD